MNTIIIDYEVGNLTAIGNSLKFLKYDYKISSDPKEIKNAEFIILPGVGSFAAGMENIKKLGLQEPILEAVLEKKTPILGICLGMQLLATESEENGLRTGLNLIPGTVLKIPEDSKLQVPNVGWRDLDRVADPKFFGENRYFYFDHSYHFVAKNSADCLANINYGGPIAAMVRKEHIYGVQFHPEKSQLSGLRLLKRILKEYSDD